MPPSAGNITARTAGAPTSGPTGAPAETSETSADGLLNADIARELGADVQAEPHGRLQGLLGLPSPHPPADPATNSRPLPVRLSGHPLLPRVPPYTAEPQIIVHGTGTRTDLSLRICAALDHHL